MAELSLSNVVNISVSQAQQGVGEYNTSNVAIFTEEVYDSGSFGSLGYKIYLEPLEVGEDFGTDSNTYKMALAIFSQQPNILANNGYLVVIPMITEIQSVAFSGTAASGTFILNFDGDATAAINWNDDATTIQTKVRALDGLEDAVVTGSIAAGFSVAMKGYYGNAPLMTATSNSLQTSAPAAITITITAPTAGETFAEAITRTASLVQYFGLMADLILPEADVLAAAAVVQALNKVVLFVFNDAAVVQPDGTIDLLTQGSFTKSRGLLYLQTEIEALIFMASYAGLGFSVVFEGSNTTITMHLKSLSGVVADSDMTQTILNLCQDAGADCYPSLQGVPKVFCSGANQFFDQVYNLGWFVGALQVAGFNYLAQSGTKIPQTENGMDGLKGAYRNICQEAVNNAYCAPGQWNSPTTFGNQANFLANISQVGYYIYSAPIASQSQVSRADREAPLIQIALKEAGAIHSSSVIVYVNA